MKTLSKKEMGTLMCEGGEEIDRRIVYVCVCERDKYIKRKIEKDSEI